MAIACGGGGSDTPDASTTTDAAAGECPTHVEFESLGDLTRIDVGYTGLAHGGSLPTNTYATYSLFDCDEECRRCKLSGPVPSDPARRPVDLKRCVDNLSQICSTDDDCGGGDKCRYQLRTVNTNQAGQCTGVFFEPVPGVGDGNPVQGTIDLVTGAASLSVVNLRTTIYGGGECETCVNDDTAFDNNKDGNCSVTTAQACDVDGSGADYVSSMDCPIGPLVSENPLPLPNISSSSQTWTLDSTRPDCTGPGAEGTSCWCGVCEDFTPCFEDSQCGSGTCGYAGTMQMPVATYNNLCDTTCTWDEGTASGTCTSTALGGLTVPCFPRSGSITVEGGVEVGDGFFVTTLAGLNCFPAGFTSGDQILGLPGILYVQNPYRIVPLTIQN